MWVLFNIFEIAFFWKCFMCTFIRKVIYPVFLRSSYITTAPKLTILTHDSYVARVQNSEGLKVDMPILSCKFFTNDWLTLTSDMHFVKFHPELVSCLLSRGKRKYAPLGMRLIWKYIRNYFLVYQLISHFLSYLQNYKEYKAKILDLKPEKYRLSVDIKKCTTSSWALGDENVIGIRALNWKCNRKTNLMQNYKSLYIKWWVSKFCIKLVFPLHQGGPVKLDSMWQHRLTRLVRDRYMYSIRITV